MLILDFDVLILLFYFSQHYTNQPCTHIFYLDYSFIFSSAGSRNRIVYVLNEIEQMNKSFWLKVVEFASDLRCRILLSKVTNKVLEFRDWIRVPKQIR